MKTICLIDDDEDVRDVISFALENDGYSVTSFENAQKALAWLQEIDSANYPCLIIVDYLMPEMDGVKFANIVKREFPKTLGTIPLAISSAKGSLNQDKILPPDVTELSKPMDLDDLLNLAKLHCS